MDKRTLYTGKDIKDFYVKFRPTYNTKLFKTIVEFYESGKGPSCHYDLAVDVGCGSGQSTFPLANYFNHVIGVDISEDQLAHAPTDSDKVEFKVGTGEDLHFLRDSSVDLVTAATACHWFDHQKFAIEVERILKPGGVLTVYGYTFPIIENVLGNEAYLEHLRLLHDYKVVHLSSTEDLYGRMLLPLATELRIDDALDMTKRVSVAEFIGLLLSSHDWWLLKQGNPHADDMQKLQTRLEEIYYEDTSMMTMKYQVVMRIGRKPL